MGEALKDGFKTGKVTNLTAFQSNGKATRISDIDTSKSKEDEIGMVTTTCIRSAS